MHWMWELVFPWKQQVTAQGLYVQWTVACPWHRGLSRHSRTPYNTKTHEQQDENNTIKHTKRGIKSVKAILNRYVIVWVLNWEIQQVSVTASLFWRTVWLSLTLSRWAQSGSVPLFLSGISCPTVLHESRCTEGKVYCSSGRTASTAQERAAVCVMVCYWERKRQCVEGLWPCMGKGFL